MKRKVSGGVCYRCSVTPQVLFTVVGVVYCCWFPFSLLSFLANGVHKAFRSAVFRVLNWFLILYLAISWTSI